MPLITVGLIALPILDACAAVPAQPDTGLPPPRVIERTITPQPSDAPSPTLAPSATPPPPTAAPINSSAASVPARPAVPSVPHAYGRPIILANYMAWYDTGSWSAGCSSDSPASGPYNFDDPSTISRQIAEARRAGLDGFAVHWGRPGDRTDASLSKILGQGFGATAAFLNHFFTARPRAPRWLRTFRTLSTLVRAVARGFAMRISPPPHSRKDSTDDSR